MPESTNKWDMMREAVAQAKNTLSAADSVANQMACILSGRLRKVDSWMLKALKKELRAFNSHTGRWDK